MQGQLFPDQVTEFRKRYKKEGATQQVIKEFQSLILEHYQNHKRDFPFREPEHYNDPYRVVVSEIMLQQTQAGRVVEKYLNFIEKFPDFKALASATTEQVLKEWTGLGYNRRALGLKRIAEMVVNELGGKVPETVEELVTFPHVGPNTAASIATFAFNRAVPFIETNIRTVYTHFFSSGENEMKDGEILDLVDQTLECRNPREWFYALMDYGVMLKQVRRKKNPRATVSRSKKKPKQGTKPFKGSNRQIRGIILKMLLTKPHDLSQIVEEVSNHAGQIPSKETMNEILKQLQDEGFLEKSGDGTYRITS